MIRYLGGGRKLDLGPAMPSPRPAYSVGGRWPSDPLAMHVGTTGSSIYVRHGEGNERPSVWTRMRGGPER